MVFIRNDAKNYKKKSQVASQRHDILDTSI